MTEQEVRARVREAIARYVGGEPRAFTVAASGAARQTHPSHAMFMVPAGSDSEGPCLIEPAVLCNHCGYCRSYGH